MADSYETVSLEFDDGITTLTLDRPAKKNAINPTLIREMYDEVLPKLHDDARDPDGGTNVLVVTGAEDAFCAGMDLDEFFLDNSDDIGGMEELTRINMEWFEDLYRFPRPTIAAVNGYCFGGGLALMCCCDLALAASDARMGLSEVRWGIMPAGGATQLPARTIGRRDFMEMSLMGRDFDGDYAERIRLVNRSFDSDDLMDAVEAWASELDQLNPTVVEYAKQAYLHETENNMSFDAAVSYEIARNNRLTQVIDRENFKAVQAFADGKFKPGIETYTDDDIAEYDN